MYVWEIERERENTKNLLPRKLWEIRPFELNGRVDVRRTHTHILYIYPSVFLFGVGGLSQNCGAAWMKKRGSHCIILSAFDAFDVVPANLHVLCETSIPVVYTYIRKVV